MKEIEVYKSGGTSTATAEHYKELYTLVRERVSAGKKGIIVVSAPDLGEPREENRVTQLLRRKAKGEDTLSRVIEIYNSIAQPLSFHFQEGLLKEGLACARREDDIVYLGEHCQAWQLSRYFTMKGLASRWIDARDVIQTDSNFGNGRVVKVNNRVFNGDDDVYVLGGFYGRDYEGNTVILPQGGSDLTADVIAASVKAVSNTNLKEVPGISATNPKFVPQARIIPELTYREARELSYGGNTVLQQEAMFWCRKAGVPIVVRSLQGENPGTSIVAERDSTKMPIVGIASKYKRDEKDLIGFAIYTIKREKDPQFFVHVLDNFAKRGISIDMIATENGIVSIAVDKNQFRGINVEALEEILHNQYKVRDVKDDQALVSVVGEGIRDPLSLRSRILQILDYDVSASYGPILGGAETNTTIYYIEEFGMNSKKGYAMQLVECFVQEGVTIKGISTTIDSISIGTHMHSAKGEIEEMCNVLTEKMEPDTISVTRNGLQLYGSMRSPSNITVAVAEERLQKTIEKLYLEFF